MYGSAWKQSEYYYYYLFSTLVVSSSISMPFIKSHHTSLNLVTDLTVVGWPKIYQWYNNQTNELIKTQKKKIYCLNIFLALSRVEDDGTFSANFPLWGHIGGGRWEYTRTTVTRSTIDDPSEPFNEPSLEVYLCEFSSKPRPPIYNQLLASIPESLTKPQA